MCLKSKFLVFRGLLAASFIGFALTACSSVSDQAVKASKEAYKHNDYKTAFIKLSQTVQYGDPRVQYALGYCYVNGLGVAPNPVLGRYYINLAAEQGYAPAQKAIKQLNQQWPIFQNNRGPAAPSAAPSAPASAPPSAPAKRYYQKPPGVPSAAPYTPPSAAPSSAPPPQKFAPTTKRSRKPAPVVEATAPAGAVHASAQGPSHAQSHMPSHAQLHKQVYRKVQLQRPVLISPPENT